MALKPLITVKDESGGQHDLQLFQKTYLRYMALSKYLFGSKAPIYDINEMPEDNEFLESARKIATALQIDWSNMSHEDSNRIMLALLEDTYNEMAKVGSKKQLAISVTLKILKPNANEQRKKK